MQQLTDTELVKRTYDAIGDIVWVERGYPIREGVADEL